jgi:hypothetical protein
VRDFERVLDARRLGGDALRRIDHDHVVIEKCASAGRDEVERSALVAR